MKLGKLSTILFCGLATTAGNFANAADSAETISTTAGPSLMDKIAEKATLSYFGVYRGGALSDLGGSLTPAVDGTPDPENPQSVENTITAGYKFDKTTTLAAVAHFFYFPIGNPAGTGQSLQNLDPMLMFEKKNLIDSGGFKLTGRITGQLPLTEGDILKPNHMITALTPTFIATYDLPNSALSVGLYGYIRGYIPSADTPSDARTYKLYVAPNANYQLTKTVAATLWVDLIQVTRRANTGFFSGMVNADVDIEPGINWDITKNISFNPILNIYPGNPTLAATSIQAILVAKAF